MAFIQLKKVNKAFTKVDKLKLNISETKELISMLESRIKFLERVYEHK